jgi:hypothetical protein
MRNNSSPLAAAFVEELRGWIAEGLLTLDWAQVKPYQPDRRINLV